jgi:hypothetical protein
MRITFGLDQAHRSIKIVSKSQNFQQKSQNLRHQVVMLIIVAPLLMLASEDQTQAIDYQIPPVTFGDSVFWTSNITGREQTSYWSFVHEFKKKLRDYFDQNRQILIKNSWEAPNC